jgi:hypothetical protein
MYLRTTQRRNKDGSVVRYLALAENVRHPEKGYVEAKVVHSFGILRGSVDSLASALLRRGRSYLSLRSVGTFEPVRR